MANYSNMVKENKQKSDEMINLALNTISEMVTDGEKVTVADLVRRTGFSRAFFYKNDTVCNSLREAQTLQTGKVFPKKADTAILKAKDHEIALLKQKNTSLQLEIARLKNLLDSKSKSEIDFIESL